MRSGSATSSGRWRCSAASSDPAAGQHVQPLGLDLSVGRASEVPLHVHQTGGGEGVEDGSRVVEHEVDVHRLAPQLGLRGGPRRRCAPRWPATRPGRARGPAVRRPGRSSEPARCTREYQAVMARPPAAAVAVAGRPSGRHLEPQLREAAAGLVDHAGRQVEAGDVGTGGGEVEPRPDRVRCPRRRRARRRPDRRCARGATGRSGLSSSSSIELVGVGGRHARRRSPDLRVTGRRHPRRARCRGRPPGPWRGRRRSRRPASTGPSRWTHRLSCWPGRRSSSRTSGVGRHSSARPVRHALHLGRGRRTCAAARCATSAPPVPAAPAAAAR